MRLIPKEGLLLKPPPRLGDTVLLEPILRTYLSKGHLVDVDSPYSDIFNLQNWPRITDSANVVRIDLEGPFKDANRVKQYHEELYNKGYDIDLITELPRIDNIEPALPRISKIRIGIIHQAKELRKIWPYWELFVKALSQHKAFDVVCFDKYRRIDGTKNFIDLPIDQLMAHMASMDLVVGNDTGPTHLAAALGIQTIVIAGVTDCEKLYSPYSERCTIVNSPKDRLVALSAKKVLKEVCIIAKSPKTDMLALGDVNKRILAKPSRNIALMRMDGLGGTLTLLDQAQKIFDLTGEKVELITRGFEELLITHPAVKKVRSVGGVDWEEILSFLWGSYYSLADIRLAVGRWYGKALAKGTDEYDDFYDDFPSDLTGLQKLGLFQTQVANRTLGLDETGIESFIYSDSNAITIKKPYMLVSTGGDPWHANLKQTKFWGSWEQALESFDNVVQIGSLHDTELKYAQNLLGKTTLVELAGLVRRADVVLCTEGGLAHLAYSCKHPKTIVLRGPTRGSLFEYPTLDYIDSYVCEPCVFKTADWFSKCVMGVDGVCMQTITPERVQFHIERIRSA